MSNLPEYLRMRVNAAPNAKNVVTIGDVLRIDTRTGEYMDRA